MALHLSARFRIVRTSAPRPASGAHSGGRRAGASCQTGMAGEAVVGAAA